MSYERSIPFRGDASKAIKAACDTLSANNFRIDSCDASHMKFTSPGMNSSRDNPLRGISNGEIYISAGNINFRGEMNCIRKFRMFLIAFIAGMAILFFVLFGFILKDKVGSKAKYIAPAPFAPWIVLIPAITRGIRKKAERAVDTLLHNAATIGNA